MTCHLRSLCGFRSTPPTIPEGYHLPFRDNSAHRSEMTSPGAGASAGRVRSAPLASKRGPHVSKEGGHASATMRAAIISSRIGGITSPSVMTGAAQAEASSFGQSAMLATVCRSNSARNAPSARRSTAGSRQYPPMTHLVPVEKHCMSAKSGSAKKPLLCRLAGSSVDLI
jgi:hypothetical protein